MADMLAGGRPRCPVHNVILVWVDRCRRCWPDDEEYAMTIRPWGAAEIDAMTDEQADVFEACLHHAYAARCALNN